jgi:hypothetical protein
LQANLSCHESASSRVFFNQKRFSAKDGRNQRATPPSKFPKAEENINRTMDAVGPSL